VSLKKDDDMRRLFVAGNWKMNLVRASGEALAKAIVDDLKATPAAVDVAVCPAFPYLSAIGSVVAGSPVWLGAQNVLEKPPGAFTGEVSLDMLLDVGTQWVILGHSERRQFFGDTDEVINRKVLAAVGRPLGVMFCIGETLAERQGGQTEQVLERQLTAGLDNFDAAKLPQLVIAYEPVWAIGTGVTATPGQAQETHAFIRKWLTFRFGTAAAQQLRIQYGGSVKPDNAAELLGQPDVDGALVGGASLKADQFLPIIRAAASVQKSA
jgi:triosephosphate isomerase (TIM)